MAATLRQQTKVILSRTKCLEQSIRNISSGQCLFGNTWHIYTKPKKKADFPPEQLPLKKDTTPEVDLKPIVIPDKVKRTPTSILEALASTVKNDINQPMYKTIDDPYLYCTSEGLKKNNLAAMESGRKTAKMMMSMYPDYITQLWEEPLPDVWRDLYQGYIYKEPGDLALLERIERRKVADAIQMYESAVNQNTQLSQETLEKFLELLTVFNNEDPDKLSDIGVFLDPPAFAKDSPFPPSTWKKDSVAEKVFAQLPAKTSTAYCYLIRGMAAQFEKAGAFNLYREMKNANMKADVFTFNLLLSVSSLDIDTMDDVITEIQTLLNDMVANDVKPDVETFNSILYACHRVSRWSGCKKFALSLLSEMKALKIEPSLATYVQLLKIFYYFKGTSASEKNPDLFIDILNDIEGKEYKPKSENDMLFYRTAMKVIVTHFPDAKLALQLHKSLQTGRNSELLGHRQLEFTYYSDFLQLLSQLEHTDVVMNVYSSVVPFIYYPTFEVGMAILENISLHNTHHYLPQIYADIQTSTLFNDKNFALSFFKIAAQHKHEPKLQSQMCDIVQSLLENWKQKLEKSKNMPAIDGEVLGEMITIYLNNDDHMKAMELFELYQKNSLVRKTSPSEISLNKLAKKLIFVQDLEASKAVMLTMLALDYQGIPALVETCLETLQLTEMQRADLEGLARSAPSEIASSTSSSSSSDSDSASDSDSTD